MSDVMVNFESYNMYTTDSLFQWDVDQYLDIRGMNLDKKPEIHFSNDAMQHAIVVQADLSSDKTIWCKIPNSLLQYPLPIKAYIGEYNNTGCHTIESIIIPVIPREKPKDYTLDVDTDDEYYSFNKLSNQIANIIAHNNDTASNTELVDARTDKDGYTWISLGEAIRNQIIKLYGALDVRDIKINQLYEKIDNIILKEIPIATTNVLGAVKVGEGLGITSDGTLYVTAKGFQTNVRQAYNIEIKSVKEKE